MSDRSVFDVQAQVAGHRMLPSSPDAERAVTNIANAMPVFSLVIVIAW